MSTDSISKNTSEDDLTNRVTTDEARDRLKDTLFSALESEDNTLINAPTSLGKSHLTATTRWRDYPEITGGEPVIHIHQTRNARDQAVQKSRAEPGVECHVLRGRTESCPVAAGDYDDELTALDGLAPSEWFDWMCDVRNITFSNAHKRLEKKRDLPCGKYCDAATQWWEIKNSGDEPAFDVLHTTANFAHVDDLIDGANVIFDERPEYGFSFKDHERLQFQRATTNLLKHRSDGERAMFDLKHAAVRDKPELRSELRDHLEDEVTIDYLFRQEESHRLAPAIGRAILDSEEVCGGRYHGKDGRVEVVMSKQDGEIRYVQHTPDLSQARCIIGLDAFPSETRWKINTVEDLSRERILSTAERRWWRQNERGLFIKQVGQATRSYTKGWRGAGKKRSRAIIQKIRERHGEDFRSCISPDSIEDDVRQIMANVGIEEPKTMHYGEQKSRNNFINELVGALIGSIDPGDENILDLLALRDLVAKPAMTKTKEDKVLRKPGREFEGPDADVAAELLASVRENNLAQAAGRYARKPGDSNSEATVYVWSDVIPQMLVDEKIETEYRSTTKKQEQFVQALKRNQSGCTAKIISEETGSDKSYIIDWLEEMEHQNKVSKSVGTGYQGATEWHWYGGDLESQVLFDS